MRLSIPVPKLCISYDVKLRNVERSTADTSRAYLHDIRKYLQLVRGGDCDAVRCLFLGNTLKGMVKTWYDQWTTAQETFTFDESTTTLLARFDPELQSRDIKARHMLAQGSYCMCPNEMIRAYQSYFEALVKMINILHVNIGDTSARAYNTGGLRIWCEMYCVYM
ncbi:hypothetical protein VaNZ11_003085 [Volvox africanus]|uniref:Retrotransposon gag domain-containing protein n=1 Tax=Volvox africanus TaxID=51714 RepID=A0ABQ5RUG3_9CHLO|nr:hypothetical protein VaNZ11_003085 [Volvox africanus]